MSKVIIMFRTAKLAETKKRYELLREFQNGKLLIDKENEENSYSISK